MAPTGKPAGRVEIGEVPFNFSKWEIGSPISFLVFWETVTILKSPMTLQVLKGSVIPIVDLHIDPEMLLPSTTQFDDAYNIREAHIGPALLPHVKYREDEAERWIGTDPNVLGALLTMANGNWDTIGPLADYWEERGDPRGEKVRSCTSYSQVCFLLKFGVSYAEAKDSVWAAMQTVGRDRDALDVVMAQSFLDQNLVMLEAAKHFGRLREVDLERKMLLDGEVYLTLDGKLKEPEDVHRKQHKGNRRNRKPVQGDSGHDRS